MHQDWTPKIRSCKSCLLFILVSFTTTTSAAAENFATRLYAQKSPAVFQITVIDRASGNKAAIGSGFIISNTGLIATNYHVVSDYILDRKTFDIEVVSHEDKKLDATLVNFDIVHDLALLSVDNANTQAVTISDHELLQGTDLYSMGNPNDLGMTIVEGTYNGLVEGSRYRKYLFSGSLNPGMSGGPVFNREGNVIGVNVSKGGEQISFLVPAKHLIDLIQSGETPSSPEQYLQHAHNQLILDQDRYFESLLNQTWKTHKFQQYQLPEKIHNSLKCWGHSMDVEEKLYEETHRHCKTTDQIYINSDLYTGAFSFDYISIKTKQLNASQFYALLENKNEMATFNNGISKDDTTNIACTTDFVSINSSNHEISPKWKISSCARKYINYENIHDSGLIAINVDTQGEERKALIISIYMQGVDRKNLSKMHKKFMSAIQ